MFAPIPLDNRILYFSRDREHFGFMSHFHPAPIELDGEKWPTVEHYYQSHKSLDPAYRQAVRDAPTASAAKRLALPSASRKRKHSWFHQNHAKPRPDWNDVKLDLMRRADLAKYTQNPGLREMLLATVDAELVEDSPSEPFWGIGPDGAGSNWAGRVLMEVRTILLSQPLHPTAALPELAAEPAPES